MCVCMGGGGGRGVRLTRAAPVVRRRALPDRPVALVLAMLEDKDIRWADQRCFHPSPSGEAVEQAEYLCL